MRQFTLTWWRVFSGAGGKPVDDEADSPVGPRRRTDERYPYRVSVSARCSSWERFLDLMTGDISAGGIFVPTNAETEVGESVDLVLGLPDEGELELTGKVVVVIDAKRARTLGKKPGIGVQLERPVDPDAMSEFHKVLAQARASVPPTPDELPALFDDAVDDPAGDAPPLADPELSVSGALPLPDAEADEADGAVDIDVDVEAESVAEPAPQAPAAAAPPAAPEVFARTPGPEPIIGIDLGTTYTSVAVAIDRRVSVLRDDHGLPSIATALSFPRPGQMIVGNAARERMVTDPKHTIVSPKRILGRQYSERDVEQYLGGAQYDNRAGPDGNVMVEMWNEPYAVPQLCGYVLAEVKRIAEARLGRDVNRVVITAPVAYGPAQSSALQRAASLAHLEVVAIIDEPTAAALANRTAKGFERVVAIYDFGGGTFDVSLVDVSGGDMRVLVTGGDSWLGGDDFDAALANAVADKLWKRHRVEVRQRAVELQKVMFASERTKRALSTAPKAELLVPELLRTAQGLMDVRMTVDRRTFRELCEPVIDQSLHTVRQALSQAEVRRDHLSAIFLSGGSTYMPAVRNAIVETFGVPVRAGVAPEHAACVGAAIYGAYLQTRLQ